MYKTYSEYYKMEVTPETRLKVIKLKILGEPIGPIFENALAIADSIEILPAFAHL